MKQKTLWLLFLSLSLVFFISPSALANFASSTPEYRVNTQITGNQLYPSIASDSSGNYVVTWTGSGQDGAVLDHTGIFGQRYNFEGVPQGMEFQVNTYTQGNQHQSDVAMNSSGNFVVIWADQARGIFGQRFNSNGTLAGSEFEISNSPSDMNPSLDIDNNGNFVVVWTNINDSGTNLIGQRFNSLGIKQGQNFQISNFYGIDEFKPSISMNKSNGSFYVSWVALDTVQDISKLFLRGYNNLANPISNEVLVSSPSGKSALSVMGSEVVVSWVADRLYFKKFDSVVRPIGSQSLVSDNQSLDEVSISANQSGFVIVWTDARNNWTDVFAKRYSSNGTALNNIEKMINTYTKYMQNFPVVTTTKDGFVAVWNNLDQTINGSGYDLFSKLLSDWAVPNSAGRGKANFPDAIWVKFLGNPNTIDKIQITGFNPLTGVETVIDTIGNFSIAKATQQGQEHVATLQPLYLCSYLYKVAGSYDYKLNVRFAYRNGEGFSRTIKIGRDGSFSYADKERACAKKL